MALKALEQFLSKNPDFDITNDNLARTSVVESLNWSSLKKEELLPQLQTYQRLLRIHPEPSVAECLSAEGVHSAHQIATTSQAVFVAQLSPVLAALESVSDGAALATDLWNKSRKISAKTTTMAMALVPEASGQASMRTSNTELFETEMPSYSQLFGPQHFCECDECRSVWGAAAYFADLMRLIGQYIANPSAGLQPIGLSLQERRPDLWNMELNCANTYNEVPYLQIANTVMAQKLTQDLGEAVAPYIAANAYPFALPLNLAEAELRAYLEALKLSLAEVYQRFQADALQVARTNMGFSTNQLNWLTSDGSDHLALSYGVYADESYTYLYSTAFFRQKTGLTSGQLDSLFSQDLKLTHSHTITALAFDKSLSQQASIDSTSALSTAMSGNQTMMCWVKANALGGDIIHKSYSGEGSIFLSTSAGGYVYRYGPDANNGNYMSLQASNDLQLDVWYHIVFVRDLDNMELTAYVNGVESASAVASYDTVVGGTSELLFARGNNGNFDGEMCHISIWSRVLSATEIQACMLTGLPDNTSELVGYWPLSEGSGDTAYDLSGNGYNALLTNIDTNSWCEKVLPPIHSQNYDVLRHQLFINQLEGEATFLSLVSATDDSDALSAIAATNAENSVSAHPTNASLDRLQRFIRLAQQLEWSFADLDWALQALQATDVDDNAIAALSEVQGLSQRFGLPVDETVALFYGVKTYAQGSGKRSQTLFDRTFNQPEPFYVTDGEKPAAYRPIYARNPFFDSEALAWNPVTDGMTDQPDANAQICSRLLAALQLNDAQLTQLVQFLGRHELWSGSSLTDDQLSAQTEANIYLTVENLSLLYKFPLWARSLKVSISQLLSLLPEILPASSLPVSDVQTGVRLVQAMLEAKNSRLSFQQLDFLLHGSSEPRQHEDFPQLTRLQQAVAELQQSALPALVQPDSFVSPNTPSDLSECYFDKLVETDFISGEGVVLDLRPVTTAQLSDALSDVLSAWSSTSDYEAVDRQKVLDADVSNIQRVLIEQKEAQQALIAQPLASTYKVAPEQLATGQWLTNKQLVRGATLGGNGQYAIQSTETLVTDEFSLSLWVQFDKLEHDGGIPINQRLYTNSVFSVGLENESNSGMSLVIWAAGGYTGWHPWAVEIGRWYHVFVTVDAAASVHAYIDGEQCYNGTLNGPYAPTIGSEIYLGSSGTDKFLYGTLTNVQFYTTAITDVAQIQQQLQHAAPLPEQRANLAAWWPMTTNGYHSYDWTDHNNHIQLQYPNSEQPNAVLRDYNLRSILTEASLSAHKADIEFALQRLIKNLAWMQWNGLSPAETQLIGNNPTPFGLASMGYGYQPGFNDLMALSAYKQQCATFGCKGEHYLEWFDNGADANALAALAGWDPNQLSTLISQFAYGDAPVVLNANDSNFATVAGVQSLIRCFEVSEQLGVNIEFLLTLRALSDLAVTGDDATWTAYTNAATAVKNTLNQRSSSEEFATLTAPIRGKLQELKRDAFAALLIWKLGETFPDIRTEDDLYEFLLLDVKMTSVVEISPLKLGLNSLQLYVQRCLNKLENGAVCEIPPSWWVWMSDYREWQANREVYLYPENYVDPTLRTLKSSLFDSLSAQVMQAPVSKETAIEAYSSYLNGLKELANLRLADSCLYTVSSSDGTEANMLCLFGQSRTETTSFFNRKALLPDGDNSTITAANMSWSPWEKIDLSIKSDFITPMYAFGRLFIFWVEQQDKSTTGFDGGNYPYMTASIYYSCQRADSGWLPPQTLASDMLMKVSNPDGSAVYFNTNNILSGFQSNSSYEKTEAWQKVVLSLLPATDNEPEKILVTLGNLVSTGDMGSIDGTPQSLQQEEARAALYDAYDRTVIIAPNLTTLFPAFTLTAGLEKTVTYPNIDVTNMDGWNGILFKNKGVYSLLADQFAPPLLYDKALQTPFLEMVPSQNLLLKFYWTMGMKWGAANINAIDGPDGSTINALHFDGSSCITIDLNSNSRFVLRSDFTFSCWCYPTNTTAADQALFDNRDGQGHGVSLYLVENTFQLWVYTEGYLSAQLPATTAIVANQWYQVVARVAPNSQTLTVLDANGNVLDSTPGAAIYSLCANGRMRLGAGASDGQTPSYFWHGYIVQPEFWEGAIPGSSGTTLLQYMSRAANATSVKNQPDWFTLNTGKESFVVLPDQASSNVGSVLEVSYSDQTVNISYRQPAGEIDTCPNYRFIRTSTSVVDDLLELLFEGGVHKLLQPDSQYLTELGYEQYGPSALASFPNSNSMDFSGAFGGYFWELFYHIPMYLAQSLQVGQQFRVAEDWYKTVFNPTLTDDQLADVAALRAAAGEEPVLPTQNYLLFRPFASPDYQSQYDVLVNEPNQVLLYEYDPFDPNAIAALRPSAYKKATVMQYISNLIAYGDYLFTEDSWESINSATMYYVTAENLLGKPAEVSVATGRMDKSYSELRSASEGDAATQFIVDLEVEVPPVSSAGSMEDAQQAAVEQRQSVLNAYFCIPSNTQLATYRKTVDDRLYKIRHGLNINGQTNNIPLFQPPIDPETAVQNSASGGAMSVAPSVSPTIPYYRFDYLLSVAKNFTAQVTQLGNELLSALEKQDAEHLNILHETQANALLSLSTQLKQDQINQLYAQQASLQENLQAANIQLNTYNNWISASWNDMELMQFGFSADSLVYNSVAREMTYLGSPLYLIPNIFGTADGGENFGGSYEAVGKSFGELGGIMSQLAGQFAIAGSFERTNDEWGLQSNLAQSSINSINAQLQAMTYQIQTAEADYGINQTQIEQSNEVISFLQTKFTNEQLYQWMSGQVSSMYFQAYNMAYKLAGMAQTAYQYEMSSDTTFLNNAGWNNLYKGLLAGDALTQSLQQLEQAYMLGNSRSLEIEKTISLMELAPNELLKLKKTGNCNFSFIELMFDRDFPGHYNRKITSISVTIPAIVGPYQNIHATLTQTANTLLTKPNVDGVSYMLGLSEAAPQSGVVRQNWNSNQAIAITTGNNDSGVFQLNFNDNRYLFFEGTGAISDWQFEMPKASNQLNFDSISDVIIQLKYTAYDGGSVFRKSVLNLEKDGSPLLKQYTGTKYVSTAQLFSNAWHQFLQTQSMSIELTRNMFPPNVGNLAFDTDDNGLTVAAQMIPVLGSAGDYEAFEASVQLTVTPPDGFDPADPFCDGAVRIDLHADLDTGSSLLLANGAIDPEAWKNLLLVIPFSGTLNWGV